MQKSEVLGAIMVASMAGCGGSVEEDSKKMGLVMDNFTVSCDDIEGGHTPFKINRYCGYEEAEAIIGPSVYVQHSNKFRNVLNCVFQGLLHFEVQQVSLAPQMDMVFIGGMSQAEASSDQGGIAFSFPDGQFYSYVADESSSGQPRQACQILTATLHETGHGLLNKALPQRDFSRYGLDEVHGHDPLASQTIMAPQAICYSNLKFSEATAKAIEENLHPDNPHPERLQNIAERCATEIAEVTNLPTPSGQQ